MSANDSTPEVLDEQWRDIPGHEGYQVSGTGGIRSQWMFGAARRLSTEWHPVRLKATREGHLQVRLRRVGYYVHRLVLLAFVGPCPDGMECLHGNDISGDNRLENLRWGTRKENLSDRDANGRVRRGDNHTTSKVTEAEVMVIRQRAAAGESYAAIAKCYPISASGIMAIARGRNFKHLPGAIPGRSRAVRAATDEGGIVPAEVV